MKTLLTIEEEPNNIAVQLYEILIKTSRRCAYDLAHAADMIKDEYWSRELRENAEHYIELFQAGNSMKDYRLSYVQHITRLKTRVASLENKLKEHNIDTDLFCSD